MPERFTTPVGRLVQGDAFEPQTKDQQGQPRLVKTGPNIGQPNPQFFLAIAFAKNDPAWPAFEAILQRVARAEWPQFFPQPGGPCVNPNFAFKIVDGDGVDRHGKPNNTKEGFAGHWVVRLQSSFAPKIFHAGRYSPADQVFDKMQLKRGYYVRANGSVKGNGNLQNPGLFVNVDMIEIAGFGPEIVSGPDASEAFSQPAALPPGASAMPVLAAPAATLPPGYGAPVAPAPAYYAPAPAPVAAPAPVYAPAPAPVAAPAVPYAGYMTAAPAAPAPAPVPVAPPAAPPPPAAGPQMTAAATATYEQYLQQGWTPDLLRQHGLMI